MFVSFQEMLAVPLITDAFKKMHYCIFSVTPTFLQE